MTIIEADVVVVGAGSVGSMASWQLAARGLRVVAIDRFTIPGPFSAYAGETRVFRMVYAEGGHYTPLLQRARDLWRELEAASGTELLTVTGVVTITDDDHPDHAALLRAGRERGLRFEVVTGDEARRRLPQHLIRDKDVALFDPEGGYVRSEHAVFSAIQLAQRHGASFLGNREVRALEQYRDRWWSGLIRKRFALRVCCWPPEQAPGRYAPRWERTLPCSLRYLPGFPSGTRVFEARSSRSSSAALMMLSSTVSPALTDGP